MTYDSEFLPLSTLERLWLIPWRMVISTLRILPPPKQHSAVLEILLSVLGPTEIQPGCLSCGVYEEKGPEHAVVFRAQWETESALHEHICSEFYPRLLVACELSNRPPEVCFHHVSATQGLDLIEQLRGRGGERHPALPKPPAR
jgi:quinol monooxygenase YgiN